MNPQQFVKRMVNDLPFFAEQNLRISPKAAGEDGFVIPLKFNRAQQYLHERAEKQIREKGKVRLVVLKGRQQGCSTYIGARFYHKTVTQPGTKTFIFAHDSDSSDTLFNMVKDYYDYSNPQLRPVLGKSNAKELVFPLIKAGYRVGTAGSKGLGRSKTNQRLHWSEVAYSPNADDHASGIMETVVDAEGTEIFWESTAGEIGNYYHRKVREAQTGEGDTELVFIPWYWQEEYTRPFDPEHDTLDDDEQQLLELYMDDGLTPEHLMWRREKIRGYQGDVLKFMREYPFSVAEAFSASDEDSFIGANLVLRARQAQPVASKAPLILGIDPARFGNDSIGFCHRIGRNVPKYGRWPQMDTVQLANRIAQEINKYSVTCCNIDAGNTGAAVYDLLKDMGYGRICHLINFGGKPDDPERYVNKRAEMYGEAKEWLMDEPCAVNNEDHEAADRFQADVTSVRYKYDRNQRLQMEPKEELKKRGLPSPDEADAFVLTFATPVSSDPTAMPAPGSTWETQIANTEFSVW